MPLWRQKGSPSSSALRWNGCAVSGQTAPWCSCCQVIGSSWGMSCWSLRDAAGAYTQGNGIRGTSKLVIDESRRVLVGATFTGPGVQELLHSATVAIAGEVTLDRLWHAVPSFPTISEVWLRLLETYGL